MRLIPLVRLRVHTFLSPHQVAEALGCRVRPGGSHLTWEAEPSFRGRVGETRFALRRSINYQNAFMPLAVGEITSAGDGSEVEITLRPFWPIIMFITLWCMGALTIGGLEFAGLTADGRHDVRVGLLAMGAALVGYLMLLGGFWLEAGRTQSALREVLEQTPERGAQSNQSIERTPSALD